MAPAPIASALRSPHNPLMPRNGRKVGDQIPIGTGSLKYGKPISSVSARVMDAHHASAGRPFGSTAPPPIGDDQYVQNFFQAALVRQPNSAEQLYWDNILRAAYPHGQNSLAMAVREMGRTVFESAEYSARNRNDRDFVFDLYESYLMRAPDDQGWDFWTLQVPS